ncbi:MAG: hypothetical protein Q8M19_04800 [Reyranella sp.]|nr:hypothetical protein [Reyranella sp.]
MTAAETVLILHYDDQVSKNRFIPRGLKVDLWHLFAEDGQGEVLIGGDDANNFFRIDVQRGDRRAVVEYEFYDDAEKFTAALTRARVCELCLLDVAQGQDPVGLRLFQELEKLAQMTVRNVAFFTAYPSHVAAISGSTGQPSLFTKPDSHERLNSFIKALILSRFAKAGLSIPESGS